MVIWTLRIYLCRGYLTRQWASISSLASSLKTSRLHFMILWNRMIRMFMKNMDSLRLIKAHSLTKTSLMGWMSFQNRDWIKEWRRIWTNHALHHSFHSKMVKVPATYNWMTLSSPTSRNKRGASASNQVFRTWEDKETQQRIHQKHLSITEPLKQ